MVIVLPNRTMLAALSPEARQRLAEDTPHEWAVFLSECEAEDKKEQKKKQRKKTAKTTNR